MENNTYITILYFNFGINERINVGVMMFDKNVSFVKIKQTKMDMVKTIYPEAFNLFEYAVNSFVEFYKENIPVYSNVERTSRYNNGIFKIDAPSFINIELNHEKFNGFFDKRI